MSAQRAKTASRRRALEAAAPLFAALGDETRLRLVRRLAGEGPLSITQLTEDTGVTRQAVTRHLDVLRDAGLVRDQRIGRERLWRFEAARFDLARRSLDQISAWWDEKLADLRHRVED